jgi:plasmid stabilization system protein ParE
MSAPFQFPPQATDDLDEVWWFIAKDNRQAADEVELEIVATCHRLAKHPLMGTKRQDITLSRYVSGPSRPSPITSSSTGPPRALCKSSPCYMESAT